MKKPEVKIQVDGKEEVNEEPCSHEAWSWDQPKRLVIYCVQFHLSDALKPISMMLFAAFCVPTEHTLFLHWCHSSPVDFLCFIYLRYGVVTALPVCVYCICATRMNYIIFPAHKKIIFLCLPVKNNMFLF